eukprot:jgi/Bigna1/87746/estExt_fgenesh1_pg.C_230189
MQLSRYKISNPAPVVIMEMQRVRLELGNYVASTFMRNASLISVLGLREDAKLAIASDVAQLEAVLHLIAPKESFAFPPKYYADLRHFKRILFLDEKAIVEKALDTSLEPVVTTQFLALGTSIGKYNRWLQSHDSKIILKRLEKLVDEEIRSKIRDGRALSSASMKQANSSLGYSAAKCELTAWVKVKRIRSCCT